MFTTYATPCKYIGIKGTYQGHGKPADNPYRSQGRVDEVDKRKVDANGTREAILDIGGYQENVFN
jgi:hypothetical protein